jgi:hypothetical protein
MTLPLIVTTPANSGQGDSPKVAFDKCNAYFGAFNSALPAAMQTSAESTAGVIPTNYGYPELTLERYGGGAGASGTANSTALASAFSVLRVKGGGILQTPAVGAPNGTFTFASAAGSIPPSTIIQGQGNQGTIWQYTGSGSFLTGPSTGSGRWTINDITINAVGQSGIGITLGDSGGNCSRITMRRVVMNFWSTALLLQGTTWSQFIECEFGSALGGTYTAPALSNNNGISIAPINTSNYSADVTFYDCTVSNNGLTGVGTTNTTTITNNTFTWINCTVQNNCVNSLSITGHTAQQFFMGLCSVFTIQGMYMEYLLGGTTQGGAGTSPSGVTTYGLSYGSISDFFINTAYNGIWDSGGTTCSAIDIFRGTILNVANDAVVMTSDTDIVLRDVSGTPIVVSGSGTVNLPTGSGLSPLTKTNVAYSTNPAIAFGTSGSITQTVQAATYNQTTNPNGGSTVTFAFRINWSAIAAPSGTVTITNALPVACKSGGPDLAVAVGYAAGLTFASGYLVVEVANGATTASVYNVQTTTAALAGSAFAATGSIIVSGSYQTA